MSKVKEIVGAPWWRGQGAALACIVLLGALVYANSLHVPWYMDDIRAIVENRDIHRLQNVLAELFTAARGIADLTFAVNYHFGGTSVVGYHLVNIAIHLVTSCLVLLLLKRVFRDRLLLALGGALIFVAHPLQTQAVTYIVQRMTSFAALFFFLALYLYVRAREAVERKPSRQWLFYGGALVCGALAVSIKENTAVLPLAIVIFDRYFLTSERPLPWRRLMCYVIPFALAPVGMALKKLLLPMFAVEAIARIGGMPDLVHLQHSSPLNYLVTEFSVVWIYLRLLLVPVGQALDYDVPIVATLWGWKSAAAFLGIAALLAAAAFLRKRLPHISAGILLFFLGLAVESTVIPLDPVFEHRLYLPMFGFAMVAMGLLMHLPGRRTAVIAVVLLTAILSVLTWQRNALWNDPIAFYEDNLRQAPTSERVHLDLANAYRKKERLAEAGDIYRRALKINPNYSLIHINLSMVYTAQKEYQKAIDILLEGLRRDPSHYKLYNNLGVLYNMLGRYNEAAASLQKGLMLEQENATVYFNLALAYERLNRLDEAIAYYRRAIALEYGNPESHFNLGSTLFKKGAEREALQAFLTASRLNPEHAGSLYNAALISLGLGDLTSARNLAQQLHQLDPEMARQVHWRIAQRQ